MAVVDAVDAKLAQTRFSKRAYAEIRRAARKSGTTVATWLRQIALERLGIDALGNKIKGLTALQKHAKSGKSAEPDLVEAIDGLCDLIFVAYGSAEDVGIDLEPFYDEVTRSNMDKRDVEQSQNGTDAPVGKAIKPPGWKEPDIKGILDTMTAERRETDGRQD